LALHLAVRAITSRGLWALPELTAHLPDEREHVDVAVARERMLDLSVEVLSETQRRTLLSLAWVDEGATFVPARPCRDRSTSRRTCRALGFPARCGS
jgi:hypothetical protein